MYIFSISVNDILYTFLVNKGEVRCTYFIGYFVINIG